MEFFKFILGFICFSASILMIIGFFSPQKSLFWYPKNRTRLASFFIYFFIMGLTSYLIPNDQPKIENVDNKIISNTENKPVKADTFREPKEEIIPEYWSYTSDIDKMTSGKKLYAYCDSYTIANFQFPYDGGSTFQLLLRKESNKSLVILSVSKGQFLGSYNSTLRVKFDDNKVENFSFSEPNDGTSNVIFINNESRFIKKLKKAKQLKIEAEFYQEGRVVIEFNVQGLKWS